MNKLVVNASEALGLILLVIIYFEYIASHVSYDLRLIVGVGLLPLIVGVIGALTIRGSYIVKAVFTSLVFPCAMLLLRFILNPNAPRDAESDTFLLFYIISVTIYVIIVVIFVYLFKVIFLEKQLKENKSKRRDSPTLTGTSVK